MDHRMNERKKVNTNKKAKQVVQTVQYSTVQYSIVQYGAVQNAHCELYFQNCCGHYWLG